MGILSGLKTRGMAVAAGALLFLALLLLNALAGRHFFRLDLTEEKEFSLSSGTRKILTELDDHVTVKLYFTKSVPPSVKPVQKQVEDLIDEFAAVSRGKIGFERVSPEEGPDQEREAQILGIPPLQLNIVEKDKEEVQKIYMGAALFYQDKKEVLPVIAQTRHLEYDLAAAILKLSSKKTPVLGLIWPQNLPPDESNPYFILSKLLSRQMMVQNFLGIEPRLADEKLDGLVLIAPQETNPELTRNLDKLWAAGVPLLILSGTVDINQSLQAHPFKTGIEEWLAGKGLTVSKELVIEPEKQNMGFAFISTGTLQYKMAYPFFVKVNAGGMSPNTITSGLEGLTFPWPNAITIHADQYPGYRFETLVRSSPASFLQEGEPQVNPEVFEDMTVKPGQSYPLTVLVESPRPEGKPSRLALVANHYFVQGNFMGDSEANLVFMQNLVDWMSWGDQLIGIRSRGKLDRPLNPLSPAQIAAIRWTHVVGIPLAVILFGLGSLYYHRKRLAREALNLEPPRA